MHPIITARRAEIAELRRMHSVRRLQVFGSATPADLDSTRSDVDLLLHDAHAA